MVTFSYLITLSSPPKNESMRYTTASRVCSVICLELNLFLQKKNFRVLFFFFCKTILFDSGSTIIYIVINSYSYLFTQSKYLSSSNKMQIKQNLTFDLIVLLKKTARCQKICHINFLIQNYYLFIVLYRGKKSVFSVS